MSRPRVVAITGASAGIKRAYINTFAPGLADRVVKRFGRQPIR